MAQITEMELAALGDLLSAEKLACAKYRSIAQGTQDAALKDRYTQLADRHQRHFETLYANKLDNLKAVDKFLKTYNLPRLNQEETNNLNRLITSSETEFVIMKEKLIANESLGLDDFTNL